MGAIFQGLKVLFLSLFGKFVGTAVANAPIYAAFILLTVTAVGLYFTAMHTLVEGLDATVPEVVQMVWGWVMPSNIVLVMSVIYAAKITRYFHYKYLDALSKRYLSVRIP